MDKWRQVASRGPSDNEGQSGEKREIFFDDLQGAGYLCGRAARALLVNLQFPVASLRFVATRFIWGGRR